MAYDPSELDGLQLDFTFRYNTRYDPRALQLDFHPSVFAPGPQQAIVPYHLDATEFGLAIMRMDRWLHIFGLLATEFGSHDVQDRAQYPAFTGVVQTEYGHFVVFNSDRTITMYGSRLTTEYGSDMEVALYGPPRLQVYSFDSFTSTNNTDVSNLLQFTGPWSFDPLVFGTADVQHMPDQFIVPSGVDSFEVGSVTVTTSPQFPLFGDGDGTEFGGHTVFLKTRSFEMDWSQFTEYGVWDTVPWLEVGPVGEVQTQMGLAEVTKTPAIQQEHTTFTGYGFGKLHSLRIITRPYSVDSLEFGPGMYVWTNRQRYYLEGFTATQFDAIDVRNYNQELRMIGIHSFEHKGWMATARLTGRQSIVESIGDTFESDTFVVTHDPQAPVFGGVEFTGFPFNTSLRNLARLVAPSGFDALEFSFSGVIISPRYIGPLGDVETEYGYQWVEYDPRYLEFQYAINLSPATEIGVFGVGHSPTPFDPRSVLHTEFGPLTAIDYDPPRPVAELSLGVQSIFGYTVVYNANRYVEPLSFKPMSEYGDRGTVTSSLQYCLPTGISPPIITVFTDVRTTEQFIAFEQDDSFDSFEYGWFRARNTYTPPPDFTQTLWFSGDDFLGIGTSAVQATTVVVSGFDSAAFGYPTVDSQVVKYRQYYPWTLWGTDMRVSDRRAVLDMTYPIGEQGNDNDFFLPGSFAVTPFYIEAEGFIFKRDHGSDLPQFGEPLVHHQNRTVTFNPWRNGSRDPNIFTEYGGWDFGMRPWIAVFESIGMTARFGSGQMIPHPQTVYFVGMDTLRIGGLESVLNESTFSFDIEVELDGFSSFDSEDGLIQNLHRDLLGSGFVSTEYGDNQPMVYHFPRGPVDVGDGDFPEFGVPWISHSPRQVYMEGEEMTKFFWTDFGIKEDVTLTSAIITMEGLDATQFGTLSQSTPTQYTTIFGYRMTAIPCFEVDHVHI